MAGRRKEKVRLVGDPPWLITFSDLVTLLLTFFVLILSMSSMDKTVLTRVNVFTKSVGFMTYRGAGRIPTRVKLIIELLENPWDIVDKPHRIKDLLFPDDIIPPEIDRSTLEENLRVLAHPEGVALVLSDKLLFEPGSSELKPLALDILAPVAEVLSYMDAEVNVAGHSDRSAADMAEPYRLSQERALSVLSYFLDQKLRRDRFSVSGYGPDMPLLAGDEPGEARAQNRRVEILVKTTPYLGGY
jgi:chemotaxis protein MotB